MLAILLGLFRLIWLFGRSQDAVALENLALPTVGYLQAQEEASTASPTGPLVLDCACQHLEGLATSPISRSPGHGCALATPAVSEQLDRTLEEAWESRSTANRQEDSAS